MNESRPKYKDAGVDIELASQLLERIKPSLEATMRPEVLNGIGGFGGLFQIDLSRCPKPVLVASIDGVGTKLIVAQMADRYDGIGHDIVNHCINDIATQGAEPLFFLDYLGIGKLSSRLYEQILQGIAEACASENVALLGGETAEMPGMYGDEFDLVGCIIGAVNKDSIITGANINAGDVVIGLASNGLHTNGYSLARHALFKQGGLTVDSTPPCLDGSVGNALLKPHTCYWPAIRLALDRGLAPRGIAHITGGGIFDNLSRVLPANCDAHLVIGVLDCPTIFSLIAEHGDVGALEMHQVFNMGVGMIWVVAKDDVDGALAILNESHIDAHAIGTIREGTGKVFLDGVS